MTFAEMRLALQYLAEERVGAARYRAAMEARAEEDAKATAAAAAASPDVVR